MLDLELIPILWLILVLLFFLLGRALVLWYFRINHAVDALESIAASLECMPAVQEMRRQREQQSQPQRRRVAP
jgi:hypothetical protein